MSLAGGILKYGSKALKHWKWLAGGAVVAHAQATDQNALKSSLDLASTMLNIRKQEGETYIGATTREVVDTITEEGTTDNFLDKLTGTLTKAKKDVGESTTQIAETTHELTTKATNTGGEMLDTATNACKKLTDGISGLLDGGSGLNMSAALMLPLAWFVFSRMGWVGKVTSMMLVMYGLTNLFKQPQAAAQTVQQDRGDGYRNKELPSASQQFEMIADQLEAGENEEMYNVRARGF